MTTPALYRKAIEGFGQRVDAVEENDLTSPVLGCPDWDVRGLIAHVTEEALWTPPLLNEQVGEEVANRVKAQLSGTDPRAIWEQSARRAVEAVEKPGALEGSVQTSAGEISARAFLAEVFADTLIHTWDLARATESDDQLDSEAVDACAEWFAATAREWRRRGAVGPPSPVAPDADAQTRLLANFGRQP